MDAGIWDMIKKYADEEAGNIGKGGMAALQQQHDIPLLNPAFYGQSNASGSNANLDNSLNKEARKVAGIGEGGATPQLQNGGASANATATGGVTDFLKNIGSSLLSYLGLGGVNGKSV